MDIRGAIEYLFELIKKLYLQYAEPYLGTIIKLAAAIIIIIFSLRIILPIIYENVLVGIIKISDKKTKNKKDDE